MFSYVRALVIRCVFLPNNVDHCRRTSTGIMIIVGERKAYLKNKKYLTKGVCGNCVCNT